MKKLNICHLTYDMEIGGAEQVIRDFVGNTDLEKFNPSVVCLENNVGPLGLKLREQGYDVFNLNRSPSFDLNLISSRRCHIKEHNVDVLHCHQYTPYSYGLRAPWFSSVKVIFTEHGRFYPERFKWKRRLINPILCYKTDAITPISEATKDALVKYEVMPKQHIEVIYNGISELADNNFDNGVLRTSLGIEDDDLVLGTVSRLDPIKNQKLMLDALAIIRKSLPRTKLLIVGDGPLRCELENYARQLEVDKNTIFTGFQLDPVNYFRLMDVFLLPSLSEGTSITLLEAMSYSKCCVVTNVGGNPEIVVDGETGFVTPNRDLDSFIDGILKLLNNDQLRVKFGDAARRRYEHYFTVDKMVSSYQDVYLRIFLNRNKCRGRFINHSSQDYCLSVGWEEPSSNVVRFNMGIWFSPVKMSNRPNS